MTIIQKVDPVIETALLKNFLIRENYDAFIATINTKKLLPTTKILLDDYKKYFDLYPESNCIDFGSFYTHFAQEWHKEEIEDLEYYRDYVFPAIQNCLDEETNTILCKLIEKQCVDDIKTIIENNLDVSKIRDLIDIYEEKTQQLNKKIDITLKTATTIDLEYMDKTKGIPWFLPSLQRSLGSLVNGQFVVISADWGTGKSAFVISEAVEALQYLNKNKLKRPIWYINSEGTEGDVFTRFLSNLYQDHIYGGFEEIWEKRIDIVRKFQTEYNEKLFIVSNMDDFPEFSYIKKQVQTLNPSLIIIDICDELVQDEDPKNLKKLYGNLRRLSNHCPIIGTTQSGDTSYRTDNGQNRNQKWLGGSKTYGSKTGKPGAADTIITIGKDDEEGTLRYINVPKKKRGEHVKITCELINKFSYYKELTL